MNNLVTFIFDKKLLTSRFLKASPGHSAEFEEILALTCSLFAERHELRYRIDIYDGNNYSHLLLILLAK